MLTGKLVFIWLCLFHILRFIMMSQLQCRFRINFKSGPTDKHETAFHFNPRMGSKVVMNSFSTGKWETEESFSDNPFKKGEDFDMFFVVKSEGYQVHVNGKELYTFKHRIPLEKVKMLNINGDVVVNLFGLIQWCMKTLMSTLTITVFQISILTNLNPASRLGLMRIFLCLLQTLPYVAPIPGGLREGMALYLKGVVPTNADRFQTGPTDKHDTAFHFNPRMDRKVVMNSFRNGKWGAEESVSDNPFKKGEAFEMFFVIKSEGYQHSMFKHRIPLEKVTTINIYGNVSISFLGFVTVSDISPLFLSKYTEDTHIKMPSL
uniref:Galectin n=1 Tax=Sinocyclocheilus grahami TaxID=75366 RepID=A0A672MWM8_SINGR